MSIWLRLSTLLTLDFALICLAWQATKLLGVWFNTPWLPENNLHTFFPIIGWFQMGGLAAAGLYGTQGQWRNYPKLFSAMLWINLLSLLIPFLDRPDQFSPQLILMHFAVMCLIFLVLGRYIADRAIQFVRKNGGVCSPVFVFCNPEDAERMVTTLSQKPHYAVLGWNDVALLGDSSRQQTVARICDLGVSEVFLCSQLPTRDLMMLYWDLRNAGITLHLSVLMTEMTSIEYRSWKLPELFSFTVSPPLVTGLDFWVKRCADFVAALVFLVVVAPVYIVIALLIKLDSPGPIFFRQTRIGLHNRPFQVWKFRTMVVNAAELQTQLEALNQNKDGILFKIKDDPRITRVGRFIRKYSLDELPQVFNILLGEMSFVGPRPLPTRDVAKFSESCFIRHEVLPGITGLWQVSGRSDIDNFDDVLNLDMAYIKEWSLGLDLKIILKTVKVVLGKTGAY
jgi:exopolysaccharide biosynthesis polyprenyl glycosylphosphotransferase